MDATDEAPRNLAASGFKPEGHRTQDVSVLHPVTIVFNGFFQTNTIYHGQSEFELTSVVRRKCVDSYEVRADRVHALITRRSQVQILPPLF